MNQPELNESTIAKYLKWEKDMASGKPRPFAYSGEAEHPFPRCVQHGPEYAPFITYEFNRSMQHTADSMPQLTKGLFNVRYKLLNSLLRNSQIYSSTGVFRIQLKIV